MTESIDRFNGLLFEFINDLKRIEPNDKDILKVELLLHAINLKKEIVIRHFQLHVLKDDLVKNIFAHNIEFFLNYEFFENDHKLNEKHSDLKGLFQRVKDILITFKNSEDGKDNIKNIFEWLCILVYYAYENLGIDPTKKISELKTLNL
jgi:hypothetical protein|tara:strand:- start:11806 stop:12252 length:447 start_codon:yes stop_codon:yes gene_type:complete